jgi:hypothetical protein
MTAPDVEQTSPAEHHRQAMHRAVDEIFRVWPHALVDADARGFPSGAGDGTGRSSIGDHSDPTGRIAMHPGKAVAWLAELHDTLHPFRVGSEPVEHTPRCQRMVHQVVETYANEWPAHSKSRERLYRLADAGSRWWPRPPKKGELVDGVTVGQRSNEIGQCALCGEPVVPGRGSQGRRWIQDPKTGERREFHRSPCWYSLRKGTS